MLLILGQGYSGTFIANAARAAGLSVTGVTRSGGPGLIRFDSPDLPDRIAAATHILSSVPPESETADGDDPVLARFGGQLRAHEGWLGYLSSTGVYGDAGGAWVDESAPVGHGRRTARTAADLRWQELGAAVLRLPGIYGPGRSALEQVRAGTAKRVLRPGHRFSRVHVEDIAGATLAAIAADWRGPLNIADTHPEEPARITEYACALLGAPPPPLLALDDAALSPMARRFWTERRLVSGEKLRRALGYRLRHPDYKAGLTAIHERTIAR
ncbi:SDR family NAD(P)-dependent oxidoreductase [Sandaracinobacter sp. RS1-74]|uniref:SDR family NAD(P)-dependent oxidoreductase n=1 Tax=Sandaracinobacteroides sayramensis TaxID=2913411 RepID=UPI001EDA057E|nr:SDR family NAD(P)-dependent oxidoreductase [Sandaracinobacteroides sayramensis]MCG2841940.1 SDR family NAD(P)-dependent oxidoreductase [Sandaracinobacteroides sayramensis]